MSQGRRVGGAVRIVTLGLLVCAGVFVVMPGLGRTPSASSQESADEGKQIFESRCSGCHSVGQGDAVGPDLEGVTDRRDREWLTRWILEPDEVIAEGDPVATEMLDRYGVEMPDLELTEGEVASVLAYLETAEGGDGPSRRPVGGGDPAAGKNLFTGTTGFENGAPACMACHSVSGIGALGGGTLGPDLTTAYQRLGDAAITWPETMAPMRAIFTDRPLTEQEKADLLAFLKAGPVGERSAASVWRLSGLAVGGAAVMFALTGLVWRGRLRDVRRTMVDRVNRPRKQERWR